VQHADTLQPAHIKKYDLSHAQVKLNGHRVAFYIQPHNARRPIVAFGRDQKPHLEMMARYPALNSPALMLLLIQLPPKTMIDCEIMGTGDAPSDVVPALKAGTFTVMPFGVPFYAGESLAHERLPVQRQRIVDMGFPFADYHSLLSPNDPESEMKRLLDEARFRKMEGWVLKGEVGWRWYKLKVEHTIDAFIVGVEAGQGKFEGQIGSIICAVYELNQDGTSGTATRVIANASGMDDATRQQMTQLHAAGRLRHRVVELKYNHIGANGRLVHPRFIRWREDKPMKFCSSKQLGTNHG
jgi:hypothetical protein